MQLDPSAREEGFCVWSPQFLCRAPSRRCCTISSVQDHEPPQPSQTTAAAPWSAPDAVASTTTGPLTETWGLPTARRGKSPLGTGAWSALFLLGLLYLVINLQGSPDTGAVAASILLAGVPLMFILLCVHTTQRCRPEPRASKRWALAWGALIATGLSSYANSLIGTEYDFSAVVVFAPIIEELAKALGLLLIFRHGHIKNALDGAVYSLLIGGGFAAVENVFYFANAFNDDLSGREPGAVIAVFVARGIVSPFAHPLFTAMCGVALGMAYGKRRLDLLPLAGLLVGVLVHGLWNYGAISGALSRYPLGAFSVFAAAAAWILFSVSRERALYRRHLPDLPDALRAELAPLTVRGLSGYELGQVEQRRREAFRQAVLWSPGDSALLVYPAIWSAPSITGYQPRPALGAPWSELTPWYDRPPTHSAADDVSFPQPGAMDE